MANLISRYKTVQFSDLYHFVRFWHEAMSHADLRTMLLIANRIVSHPSEFNGFPREFTPRIIRKHFPVTCNSCPLGNLNQRPSVVSTDSSTPAREIVILSFSPVRKWRSISMVRFPLLTPLVLDLLRLLPPSRVLYMYWIVLAVCRATGLLWGKTRSQDSLAKIAVRGWYTILHTTIPMQI